MAEDRVTQHIIEVAQNANGDATPQDRVSQCFIEVAQNANGDPAPQNRVTQHFIEVIGQFRRTDPPGIRSDSGGVSSSDPRGFTLLQRFSAK